MHTDSRNVVPFEKPRFSSGIKAIALVIGLTAIALVADHAFFVAPHAQARSSSAAAYEAPVSVDGFALPQNLRPTAADVEAPPASF